LKLALADALRRIARVVLPPMPGGRRAAHAVLDDVQSAVSRNDMSAAANAMQRLEFGAVDEDIIKRADAVFADMTAGKRIVASFDPARMPGPGELVIRYGNYPHDYNTLAGNNPLKRHISLFWNLRHDAVESDPRWEGVDRIYVINLDSRPDRYDSILRELARARAPFDRVERVSARVGRSHGEDARLNGTEGCLLSHLALLRASRDAGHRNVLVLEDDFSFTDDIEQHLDDLRAFIDRRYDYLVCLVATSRAGALVPKDDLVNLSYQPVTTTAGYLVSSQGIAALLPVWEAALRELAATGDANRCAADRSWRVLQSSQQFFVFRRKFGFQLSGISDIEGNVQRSFD
jgi:hypothetical protein